LFARRRPRWPQARPGGIFDFRLAVVLGDAGCAALFAARDQCEINWWNSLTPTQRAAELAKWGLIGIDLGVCLATLDPVCLALISGGAAVDATLEPCGGGTLFPDNSCFTSDCKRGSCAKLWPNPPACGPLGLSPTSVCDACPGACDFTTCTCPTT